MRRLRSMQTTSDDRAGGLAQTPGFWGLRSPEGIILWQGIPARSAATRRTMKNLPAKGNFFMRRV
jgi:hypothetical protein